MTTRVECKGNCFGMPCRDCEESYRKMNYPDDFDKAMHDQIENNYSDEIEEYEEIK